MNLAARRSFVNRVIACVLLTFAAACIAAQTPAVPDSAPQTPAAQSAPIQASPAPPAPSPSPPHPDWKTYSFSADGFSASFPSEPVEQKQTVQTSAGTFELRTYLAASPSAALYIGVCDYGEAAMESDPDAVLDGAKNGAVSNVNARLISSKKVMLGIYPGIAFEAESPASHFFGRIYLVGSILYQVFVAPAAGENFPEAARFLDSFQLIPRASQ